MLSTTDPGTGCATALYVNAKIGRYSRVRRRNRTMVLYFGLEHEHISGEHTHFRELPGGHERGAVE